MQEPQNRFDPHVAGNRPLGLDGPTSDIDTPCYANPDAFTRAVCEAYGKCDAFSVDSGPVEKIDHRLVCPVWTPLQVNGGATEVKLKKFDSDTVFGRPGQPAELGLIYVQFAMSDASFATGQIYGTVGGHGQP